MENILTNLAPHAGTIAAIGILVLALFGAIQLLVSTRNWVKAERDSIESRSKLYEAEDVLNQFRRDKQLEAQIEAAREVMSVDITLGGRGNYRYTLRDADDKCIGLGRPQGWKTRKEVVDLLDRIARAKLVVREK